MKLIQRRSWSDLRIYIAFIFLVLHDFCMPGNQNDSLLENDACPGISVGATHAKYV